MRKIIPILLLASSPALSAECPNVSDALSKHIKQHADQIRGAEFCEFRNVYKDEYGEFVLYSIEGACFEQQQPSGSCGNTHHRYITALIDGKIIASKRVGGRGQFSPNKITRREHKIVLSGLTYSPQDSMCCPSVAAQRELQILNSEFSPIGESE